MARKKICILPKLNDCHGDTSKRWFVYYSYRNPLDDKMQRFRVYEGFDDYRTKKDKYAHAERLIEHYKNLLRTGWNPFGSLDEDVLYEDQIQYKHENQFYGKMRRSNKNFNYYASKFMDEKGELRHKTFKTYQSKYRVFSKWLTSKGIAENHISTIDNKIIVAFFTYLNQETK